VLVNPIVYMSEGLRAALTPLAHMNEAFILLGLTGFLVLLTWVGMRGFRRRVLS
jgi:ABC-2 type transport system permease protein